MKKITVCLLVCIFIFGVTGCKSRDVKVVEELIDEIGEVDIDSGKAIEEAQDAYDDLTPSERREVENYSVLEDAIEAYNMIPVGTWVATYTEDTYSYYYDRSTRYDHFSEPGDTVEIIAELSSDGRGVGYRHNVDTGATDETGSFSWSIDFDGVVDVGGASYRLRLVDDEFALLTLDNYGYDFYMQGSSSSGGFGK